MMTIMSLKNLITSLSGLTSKTMVDLQKNIQQEHMDTEEHLNSLYAKNGNVKQGQDCAKTEQMITQLIEQEERVKNI